MTTLVDEVLANMRAVTSSHPDKCDQDPFALFWGAGENGRTLDPKPKPKPAPPMVVK
jgi:hypothetical protein